MKTTLSWLKEHLDTDANIATIITTLTKIGLEVENIDDKAARFSPFTVAKVISCTPHPNADNLNLCIVDSGDGHDLQIICGAPNVRIGLKAVLARIGSIIPQTGAVLKQSRIRGLESQGMLCSSAEMGLGTDHSGIIELGDSTPIGAPFADVLGLNDVVIDINITPNRSDCLGVAGIARDLAAAGLGRLKSTQIKAIAGNNPSPISVKIADNAKQACPVFYGRYIKGVVNGPSPDWLKNKLISIGLRSISALVDITNFLTFDRNRPLHVFDASKIDGDLIIRMGNAGESFAALDGKTHMISPSMLVIADHSKPLSLAGIIGGIDSAVNEQTTDIFIESAYFDPANIAATGRGLNINSDARYRFERGIDPSSVIEGMEYASQLIIGICGGTAFDIVVAGTIPEQKSICHFNPERLTKLTGLSVNEPQMLKILSDLGFEVNSQQIPWQVKIPLWRHDVTMEVDLVEEIARIIGFDQLPNLPLPQLLAKPDLRQRDLQRMRRLFASRGLTETINYSFISAVQAKAFSDDISSLTLINPISAEMAVMRPSLIPGLAVVAIRNRDHGVENCSLFEVATIFNPQAPQEQINAVAGLRMGANTQRHWQNRGWNFDCFDVKSDLINLFNEFGLPSQNLFITKSTLTWLHPHQSGEIRLGGKQLLAVFGMLHPDLYDLFDIKSPVFVFEAYIDCLPQINTDKIKPVFIRSSYPAAARDFAFITDNSLAVQELIKAIYRIDRQLITDVSVFDYYKGDKIEAGKISIAISVRFEPVLKTLTDSDIDALSQAIIAAAAKLGAILRDGSKL